MNGWHETYNDFPGPDVVCGHLVQIPVPPARPDPPSACSIAAARSAAAYGRRTVTAAG
jgi:hypothetical protein